MVTSPKPCKEEVQWRDIITHSADPRDRIGLQSTKISHSAGLQSHVFLLKTAVFSARSYFFFEISKAALEPCRGRRPAMRCVVCRYSQRRSYVYLDKFVLHRGELISKAASKHCREWWHPQRGWRSPQRTRWCSTSPVTLWSALRRHDVRCDGWMKHAGPAVSILIWACTVTFKRHLCECAIALWWRWHLRIVLKHNETGAVSSICAFIHFASSSHIIAFVLKWLYMLAVKARLQTTTKFPWPQMEVNRKLIVVS